MQVLCCSRAVDLLSSEYPDITVKDIQEYLLALVVEDKVSTKIISLHRQ